MGEDPGQIRQDIEDTRERMGETVSALAYKADVPTRVKDSVADKRDRLKAQMSSAGSSVSDAAPDGEDVREGAKRAVGIAQENPLGLAIGGVAIGFLVGLTLPTTRVEEERIGPLASDVKDKAVETGQEALERGKEVAQGAAQAAAETAVETGREQAGELRSSVAEKAQEVTPGESDGMASGGTPTV